MIPGTNVAKISWHLSHSWGKTPRNLTQETCPEQGSNLGLLRDKCTCYHLLHSDGQHCYYTAYKQVKVFVVLVLVAACVRSNFCWARQVCSRRKQQNEGLKWWSQFGTALKGKVWWSMISSTPVVQWLSYSTLDPRFTGSIPARVDGLFQSIKILSMTSFGREVSRWSCVIDLRHIKEPQAEIGASEQNLSASSRSI